MKRLYTLLWCIAMVAIFSFISTNIFATTFTVTNLNDSGAGSLRQAIIDANAAGAGPHTINFAVSGTIPISSSLPAIANSGITIDGGGTITINAQGGDINRDIFTINASNTTVKGFTLQNTGTQVFQVASGLSNVTIQDIVVNHTSNFIDNIVYLSGTSTNMTIKNVMCVAGMQDCVGLDIGRAFYFTGGTQTNLTIEDITVNAICEGIVFRDASVNNLDIINATIYGSINMIVFDNTGGAVETATDVTIDGETTASLYSQRDGGGSGMIYSDFTNTTWQIKNLTIDADRANTTDDANYGIRFDNSASGITIENVTMDDAEIYGLWFNGIATNIAIQNSNFENFDGWTGTQMFRFENTVTTLNITNTDINLDQTGTTDDGDYGIVFGYGYQKTGVTLNDVTLNEADADGIYVDGPVTNFTLSNSALTNNYDNIEFYNGYNHSNLNITNSTITGATRAGILINTGAGINSDTISGNNISNNSSNGLWFIYGDGNKAYTVSGNTISYNGGAGIYLNAGPDAINISQNNIFRNTGNGIELDGGGNLSYEGANRPTITGSAETTPGDYNVTFSLPTICNAAGGCTVQIFANASSDDVEGHYYVQEFTGLAAGSHTKLVDLCAVAPCNSVPYGFWTATLKVANTGSVSEFSNKQSMKTQGPGAVNTGVALWLDAQDALSGNLPGGTGWQDRSGNDRDFTTVGSDPNRSTGGLNYNHYVQFDGDDAVWRPSFTTGFTAGEVFAVTRGYYRHANSGPPFDMGGFSGWNAHYTWSNQILYEPFGISDPFAWNPVDKYILDDKTDRTTVPNASTTDTRAWNIYQVGADNTQWQTGFNGVMHMTASTNTAQFLGVGGNPNNHIGWRGYYFYGDVAEVVFYSRVLTPTERQKVQSYLALKYGTTLDQALGANNYIASNVSNMWVNDNDGYRWNIFGIGRDDDSGLQQKQSESIEQNAILSVAIGSTIATTNEANTAIISTDRSFLTFADNNQLQRFGPAVSATNSNFRMHRTWKVDKTANWTSGSTVTFKFGEDFAGNYLLLSSNETFTGITSELLLDANGAVTFNSDLLAHGSYFTVGAKMQLPGCVAVPSVSYPNYQEYYNAVHYPFLGAGGIGYGYNTNPATQSNENNIAFSGYYARNFTNSFACDNCIFTYRAKFTAPTNG